MTLNTAIEKDALKRSELPITAGELFANAEGIRTRETECDTVADMVKARASAGQTEKLWMQKGG